MNKTLLTTVAALALATGSAQAATYTLDFTGSGEVLDTYGDNGQADLTYSAIDANAFGNVSVIGELYFWGTGYGDLDGAAWGGPNPSHGEIMIEAVSPSETVTIDSFDMGGWAADENAEWHIFDLAWNLLGSGSGIAPNTGSHLSVTAGISGLGGLIFQWGSDAWDVGVENFTYSVSGVAPVPIPAPALLLLGGLGALAGLRRRRRTTTA